MKIRPLPELFGIALLIVGCVYDDAKRCGPNQREISDDRCICSAGFVPGDDGCVPCGENEVESGGSCECAEGYARAGEGEACLPQPSGLGDECDVAEAPCGSEEFPECHVVSGTTGYCTTSGCSSNDDCSGGFRCQSTDEGSYCRRPATGRGDKCEGNADCTGEADFCEQLQAGVCVVSCSTDSQCFDDEGCCDLSPFGGGTICVPDGKCPTEGG